MIAWRYKKAFRLVQTLNSLIRKYNKNVHFTTLPC